MTVRRRKSRIRSLFAFMALSPTSLIRIASKVSSNAELLAMTLTAGLAGSVCSAAPANPEALSAQQLVDLNIEDLFNVQMLTASKHDQKMTEAPAIVSVITHDDIAFWHYRSVAEALQHTPGLYGIDDYVSPNIGVRGINGGLRGYSKVLKLMINGQVIGFRSDGTHFMGPELIPMNIVERIEIVRGPASALYGENAFLGVINIITIGSSVSDKQRDKVGIDLYDYPDALDSDYGGGISAHYFYHDTQWQTLLSASTEQRNYDDESLPDSSPHRVYFVNLSNRSAETQQRPKSALLQAQYSAQDWQAELLGHYSKIDSVAEFLDFGTLNAENRVALEQHTVQVKLKGQLAGKWQWVIALDRATGGPANDEHLTLNGSTGTHPQREFSYQTEEGNLEATYQYTDLSSLGMGVDFSDDKESLLRIFTVDDSSGQRTAISLDQGDLSLRNRGTYAQWVTQLWPALTMTLNLRSDRHSLYGDTTNYRIAGVYQINSNWSTKLLRGTSYQAPSAGQLYAQPLYPGDVLGNPDLKAEHAKTSEWAIDGEWPGASINLSIYQTNVRDKVELLPVGSNFVPRNLAEQKGYGSELEINWRKAAHTLRAALAYQHTQTSVEVPFLGRQTTPTDSYPRVTFDLRWQYALSDRDQLGCDFYYASARRASDSNIRENLQEPYSLKQYHLFNVIYSHHWRAQEFSLTVNNVANMKYAESGFNGIDIPARGREIQLGYAIRYR